MPVCSGRLLPITMSSFFILCMFAHTSRVANHCTSDPVADKKVRMMCESCRRDRDQHENRRQGEP